MKKVLAVLLAIVMAFSVSVMAFAQGGFVSSPSNNEAPEVEDVEYEDGSCKPEIIITPFIDRDKLEKLKNEALVAAYNEISSNKDLSKICAGLISVATSFGISVLRLAVSDLFDISAYHIEDHESCGMITLTLASETFDNFVALIHRNDDGTWEVIKNVIYNKEKRTISFSADSFSPFAIVVDTGKEQPPYTGSDIIIPAIVMFISAVSLAAVLVTLKKKQRI